MKKHFLILGMICLVATTSITLNSCKKGTDDPMISLRSRKSRLVGDWKLTEGKVDNTNNSNVSTEVYNGSTKVVTQGSNSSTTNYTKEISIVKDGTYTSTEVETDVNTTSIFSYTTTTTTTTTTESAGKWSFLGGQGDAKNKEYVYMTETSSKQTQRVVVTTNVPGQSSDDTSVSTSSSNNSFGGTWQLTELKNKEIKFSTSFDDTNVNASGTQSISKSIGSFTLTAK